MSPYRLPPRYFPYDSTRRIVYGLRLSVPLYDAYSRAVLRIQRNKVCPSRLERSRCRHSLAIGEALRLVLPSCTYSSYRFNSALIALIHSRVSIVHMYPPSPSRKLASKDRYVNKSSILRLFILFIILV